MRPDGGAARTLQLADLPSPEGVEGVNASAAEAAEDAAVATLTRAIRQDHAAGIALVSSFGAASVVLLHMVARIDPQTPVIFLQTGKHFSETDTYRERLTQELGLRDVRLVTPDPVALSVDDPAGDRHARHPEVCCRIRKVAPLETALAPFAAWINGRRRGQTSSRARLSTIETDAAGRTKINPLAAWQVSDVAAYMARHDLPEHPLVARGYPSIGCAPCTTPVGPGEDERAGRWRGSRRDECGIHVVNGQLVRFARPAAPLDLV